MSSISSHLPYSDLKYIYFFLTENDTEKGADDEKEKETEKEEDVKMDDGNFDFYFVS